MLVYACLDALGEEWSQERVRSPRQQHQNAEQGQRHGDAPRADAGDAHGVGEGADDVDDERQCANQQQLLVHHNLAVKKMSFHAAMELLIFQLQIR